MNKGKTTELGQRIKLIRKSKDLTQAEFGMLVGGLYNGSVSQWETGYCKPTAKHLNRIAEIAGITVEELTNEASTIEKRAVSQKVLGNRIRKIRNQVEFTQAEFAELLGVTTLSISNWERGKNAPTPNNLEKIAEAGEIEVEELTHRIVPTPLIQKPKAKQKTESSMKKETSTQKKTPVKDITPTKKEGASTKAPQSKAKPVAEKKQGRISARSVIKQQLEDEFKAIELDIKSKGIDAMWDDSNLIEFYKHAYRNICARINKRKTDPFVYLGKNSILEKFKEFFFNNQRRMNDQTFEDFEEVLKELYKAKAA